MRGWLVLIILVVIVGAGFAIYSNTHQGQAAAPVATSTTDIIPGVSTIEYRDTEFGFSIKYPETASSSRTNFDGYLPLTQAPVVSYVLPRSMGEGTNLSEAGIYIGATSTPKIVAACTKASGDAAESAAGTATLNGTDFFVFKSSGAGAGNFYETTAYRAVRNGMCFELVELLHSTNIGNYDPGTVVEFDRLKFQGYLDGMASSFSFI